MNIKEVILKAKEETQQETGSFKYDFIYDELLTLINE
jgi:hypothetical protein